MVDKNQQDHHTAKIDGHPYLSVMLGDVREQAERFRLTVEAAYNGAEYVCDIRTHQGKLVLDSCSVREVSAYIKGRQHEEQRWLAEFDEHSSSE